MLAKTPKKPKDVVGSLKLPETGGKLFIPGFHRTQEEESAISIVYEKIQPGRISCTYGPGFYMTRTYATQNRERMINNYGGHVVRCRVDISRFICFDRAIAKRVWGDGHSLKEQLSHFGPWTTVHQDFIDGLSTVLDNFWNKRDLIKDKSKRRPTGIPGLLLKKKRRLDTRYLKYYGQNIYKTADVARLCHKHLTLHKKVPGIAYTGTADGACLVAHHLDRVVPMTIAHIKEPTPAKQAAWTSPDNNDLRKKLSPDKYLRDDIATYVQSLTWPAGWTLSQKQGLIYQSAKALPQNPVDQLAFCLAVNRRCRHPSLHSVRDSVMEQFAANIVTILPLHQLPVFDYETNEKAGVEPLVKKPSRLKTRVLSHQKSNLKPGDRLVRIIGQTVLNDYLRYALFMKIAEYHKGQLEKLKKDLIYIVQNRPHQTYHIREELVGWFGGYLSNYGSINQQTGFGDYVDGLAQIELVMTLKRRPDLGRFVVTPKRAPPLYALIGQDEYTHFMRSQLLKLYDAFHKDPAFNKDPTIKAILKGWNKKYGKTYRDQIKVSPSYHTIGRKLEG